MSLIEEFVFATNNPNKLREIRQIAPPNITIFSLADRGCHEELPETSETLEGNAEQKARYFYQHYGGNCFADDTGLEVDALGGAPGVYTARYAGETCSALDNMNKLLLDLEGEKNRRAVFRTVICLIREGEALHFEGSVEGTIAIKRKGEQGFGYDPVFCPDGYEGFTFAELSAEQKNKVSHRGRAMQRFIAYLNRLDTSQ